LLLPSTVARKATAQFYPAMATHFEGVWPNAPILKAERTPKSLCRFIRFQHGQPNLWLSQRPQLSTVE
jgi:hypothetical protein